MCTCMSGPAGVQKEASYPAGENARRFGENVDGGRQSHSSSADDHYL